MGTTANTQCSRSTSPQLPEFPSTKLRSFDTNIDSQKQQDNTGWTWQQRQDFTHNSRPHKRNHRQPQKMALHQETEEKAQMKANDGENSSLALQPRQRRRTSRRQAVPSPSSHPHHSASTAIPLPNTPALSKDKAKQLPQVNDHWQNKSMCDTKKRPEKTNMTTLRKEAYIPPHLRKRTLTNVARANMTNNGTAADGSPNSSGTTKCTVPTKPESIPGCAVAPHVTPPSPPTTQDEPSAHNNPNATVFNGWDIPLVIHHPPAVERGKKPRLPRGKQPYKKTAWPKNKDLKPIPASSGSDGGVACWAKYNNGDLGYGAEKALGWNDDWVPPPGSWSAREGFHDHQLRDHVEQWVNGHAPECLEAIYYPSDTFSPDSETCKELAPRYWLEAKIEGTNLRESWKIVSTAQPKPLDEEDLTSHPPWWELYEEVFYTEVVEEGDSVQKHFHHASSYLNALPVPEARVNFKDAEHPVLPVHLASVAEKIEAIRRHRAEKQRQMEAKRNRPISAPNPSMFPLEDRRLRSRANIYIRPVQPADIKGITEIYNYYVEQTIHATEFDRRTEAQMRRRINDITIAGLPYLVAISKTIPLDPTTGYVTEKLVGYINLDDYCSQASLFRYTFEMELFVHHVYESMGIGKCLMDRLLEMADTSYNACGGYDYINEYEYLKTGPARVIKTILLNVHHENGEDVENGWQGKFLHFFKFTRVGRLPRVGYKLGKAVDVSVYAHYTKEEINANGRPTVTG